MTLYMVQFVNSGTGSFFRNGKELKLCTISSHFCSSELLAIEDLIDSLFEEDGVFIESKLCAVSIKENIVNKSGGKVLNLNNIFPDSRCGIDGCFIFELKTITIL